jgi:hypothetical protein
MKDIDQIVATYDARVLERGPVLREMRSVRDTYNGDIVVPLPELDRNEKAAVANLLNTGIDQMAGRVSSVLPTIFCPPRNESKTREVAQATLRTKAMYGWWDANDYDIMQMRRARWMLGYACAPVQIKPPTRQQVQGGIYTPQWHTRDPLTAFPSAPTRHDDMTPSDCVFSYVRSHGWLADTYPEAFDRLRRPKGVRRDDPVTVLEWVDADELVLLAFGDRNADVGMISGPRGRDSFGAGSSRGGWVGSDTVVELERRPNRAGMCTVVVPGRVTLDRIMSQFSAMIGMYETSAKLTALSIIAVEKGIFPDTYLIGRDGKQPKFLSGPHDGRTGMVNVVMDGDIKEVATNPGFQTNPMIDRLERSQRLEGNIPAEFGGESASNIRTGKRGDAVLGAAVDFPIQEQQKLLAKSAKHELQRAVAVSKGYCGAKKTSTYVNWKGARGSIEYTPNELFTTDNVVVSYAQAGSDLNGLMILTGQAVGMGVMSKKTAASILPIIEDPEFEHDQTMREGMEAALFAGVQQKINAGEIAPVDAAWLIQQVGGNKRELAEAIIELDRRVQERQASAGEMGAPDGPVLPGSPEAMAGLAAGTPAEAQAAQPSIGGPNESQENLGALLSRLRQPQMVLPSERSA